MSKITLEVTNDNLKTVLSIIENLKDGLIEHIEIDGNVTKQKRLYQPKLNKVIKENEHVSGKYIDRASFKKRLKKVEK